MAAGDVKLGGDVKAALAVAALLTLAAIGVGDASLGIAVTLIDLLLFVYCMFRVPVRYSMMLLMFFAFVLPNPAEGQSTDWAPPFTIVGAVLLNHLNTIDRTMGFLSALPFSGMDILLVVLGLVVMYRKSTGSKIDTAGRIATPKPLITMAYVSLLGTAFVWVSGLVRGGNFGMSLWQLFSVVYLPVLFLLFQYSLRGPVDHPALAKVLLAAATYKCFLAEFIATQIKVPMNPETGSTRPAYGTSHSDSMLFAVAFVLVLVPLVERAAKKAKWRAAIFVPIIAMGIAANNRRLAWVQVALVFLSVYVISRPSGLKRKITRVLLASLPVIAVYMAVGWNNQYGTAFKPVRMFRSVVDAKSDGSSLWREWENVDLIVTFRSNPLFGVGYGVPYEEAIVLPAVDYPLERYTPHNSLLGLWAYCGATGFATLTMLWAGGVYFAMRTYYKSTDPAHRTAALVCFSAVLAYLLQCWGDLGLGTNTGVFLMGCSIACSGKLAMASKQWGAVAKPAASPSVDPR